ncbi:MAG: diaminopimelate epimerase [Alphaproteobacteria bacterium]|nr:diaminopimelate epimerase [Alphaproteobacteria bacterium]
MQLIPTGFLSQHLSGGGAGLRPFVKNHGLRNHFVFLDHRGEHLPLSTEEIVRICDVHSGVGAEQVVTIEAPSEMARAQAAHAAIRIFNIDGFEAGACGNATRCAAQILFEETRSSELVFETVAGLLRCWKEENGEISVRLGPITMDWQRIPLAGAADTRHLPIASGPLRDGLALNIGNPHAVFFVDSFDAVDIAATAPAIQNNPLFAEGANVGIAEVIDGGTLRLAVWERPGFLSEACGTGACVAVFAGRLRGLLSSDIVSVRLPGGLLRIRLEPDGMAVMTGPVAFCCCGYV